MSQSADDKYIKNMMLVRLKPNEPPVKIEVWTKRDLTEILEEVKRHRAARLAKLKQN
jgi:hypothetical protein